MWIWLKIALNSLFPVHCAAKMAFAIAIVSRSRLELIQLRPFIPITNATWIYLGINFINSESLFRNLRAMLISQLKTKPSRKTPRHCFSPTNPCKWVQSRNLCWPPEFLQILNQQFEHPDDFSLLHLQRCDDQTNSIEFTVLRMYARTHVEQWFWCLYYGLHIHSQTISPQSTNWLYILMISSSSFLCVWVRVVPLTLNMKFLAYKIVFFDSCAE